LNITAYHKEGWVTAWLKSNIRQTVHKVALQHVTQTHTHTHKQTDAAECITAPIYGL